MSKMQISIVTITKNDAEGLRRTLDSICRLNYKDYELIVVHGDEKEKYKEIISEYGGIISIFREDSGKGIYAAMNQGISLASSEYVIFMNSGDTFYARKSLDNIDFSAESDVYYGKSVNEHCEFVFTDSNLGVNNVWKNMPFSHQAQITKLECLKKRPLDTSYKISADFEYILWLVSSKKTFRALPNIIVKNAPGGVSSTSKIKRVLECYRAAVKYYNCTDVHRFYINKLILFIREKYTIVNENKSGC